MTEWEELANAIIEQAAKDYRAAQKKLKNLSTDGTRPTGKINYWGYTPKACYFAPKAAYAGEGRDTDREFRELVRALQL